jgi:hypothetical protein
MHYLIDFDSRSVEFKSEDFVILQDYIQTNKLELALVIVSSAKDVFEYLSFEEMKDLYSTLTLDEGEWDNSDNLQPSIDCWQALEEYQNDFPVFRASKGKKALKSRAVNDDPVVKTKTETAKAAKPAKRLRTPKIDLDMGQELLVVDGKSKAGSILNTIATAIEDEMCGSVQEVVDYIVANHIKGKSGDPADISYAVRSIKDLIKMGKLSLEEEL